MPDMLEGLGELVNLVEIKVDSIKIRASEWQTVVAGNIIISIKIKNIEELCNDIISWSVSLINIKHIP